MDEAQNPEHDVAQLNSSQATFVPPRESQPSTSAQGSSTPLNDWRNEEGESDAVITDRAGGQTSGPQSDRKRVSFAEALKQFQDKLDRDFLTFEHELLEKDPQDVVNDIEEWDLLENEYQTEVGNVVAQEQDIMDAFDARFKQFLLWMQISNEGETSRALKRIKTQSAFVQNSEATLVGQEQHYEKVMAAFQSAMRLLNQPS